MSILTKTWSIIRQRMIWQRHQRVASLWNRLIVQDHAGLLSHYPLQPKVDLPPNGVIWQFWGQGLTADRLPAIVKLCFQSVDDFKGDYTVIRVDDNTVSQYVDLPDFILEKKAAGIISPTFFSDILRLALLKTYGGVWLDATILLTDNLPTAFREQDFFVYQRDAAEKYTNYWKNTYAFYWGWDKRHKVKMLNSIIFAKKHDPLLSCMTDLLFNYWKTANKAINYFIFQILHEQLMVSGVGYDRGQIVSDVTPHLLQTKLAGGNYPISYSEIFERTSMHKMTYFQEDTVEYLEGVLRENLTAFNNKQGNLK
ncbi:capsular polysaccharide synthesis protein [Sphingobacterium sp. BIGb0165]|uniref:capsular polysaccharide synthesis protein n=1 Tax=Sphingobacterium sp. BIGb0165 TaxID=2940615 RepID=UPI002166C9E2|nr:capsular polysaccharide synthesis protein [Sphingobacterium sp. BIGb0165]MCS4226491.1 hypothetical protein [Sphingobacterium sp. BIGb0165]